MVTVCLELCTILIWLGRLNLNKYNKIKLKVSTSLFLISIFVFSLSSNLEEKGRGVKVNQLKDVSYSSKENCGVLNIRWSNVCVCVCLCTSLRRFLMSAVFFSS